MDEVTVLLTFMGSERSNIATTGVTHEKYLPTPGLLRSKSGVSGFYSPRTPERLPSNTGE